MSVECYRTRGTGYRSRGKNTYYNEGKRISKKVASYISPKLPKCVSKTKSIEIKNLKKQLKEVMTHREQYKTTSADLDNRLKTMNDQLDKLQEERLTLIEEVNKREKIIYSKNDEIVERMEVIGRLDAENRELKDNLKNSVNDLKKLKSEYEDLKDDLEDLKEKATRYYNEGQTLEQENSVLKQRVIDADDTIKVYTDKYADDMGQADEEINKLNQELEQKTRDADECEADKLALQEDINILRNTAENLRNKLVEEKDDCLLRVQRAIEETDGNISRREAQRYEKELSDLNGRLRLADEALDELRKAGSLEGKKMAPKSVKRAIKKMKKAGANIKFVE